MTALVTWLLRKRSDQNKTGPNSDIRDTKSKLKKSVIHWCGLKPNTFLRKVTALRILVGLAWAVRRQIGNTVLGGCNRRPLEKFTAFKVLSGWCSTKQGKLFLENTSSTIVLRLTKSTIYTRFS